MSSMALTVTLLVIAFAIFLEITRTLNRRKKKMIRLLQEEYRFLHADSENGDDSVIDRFTKFREKVDELGLTPENFDTKSFDSLEIMVFNTFCKHMAKWRFKHLKLKEERNALADKLPSEYDPEVVRLDDAYHKSADVLYKMQQKAGNFMVNHSSVYSDLALELMSTARE